MKTIKQLLFSESKSVETEKYEAIIKALVSQDIRTRTDISSEAKRADLAKLHLLSNPFSGFIKDFRVDIIDDLLVHYYVLGLSLQRKSRKELVDVLKNILYTEANQQKSFFGRLKEFFSGGENR
ncbi:MAG: hypothetical protein ACXQS5_03870 [Candidatus Methanospirareceae archaeon]